MNVNPKRSWVVVAGVVLAAFVGISLGLFLGSPDDASPSLVMLGKRQEGGKEIVEFRVDVPWRWPTVLKTARVLDQDGEREPNWASEKHPIDSYFTNSSPTFGVVAPAGSPVWKLRLVVWAEQRGVQQKFRWMAEVWHTERRIAWPRLQITMPYSLGSDLITNAAPSAADALRP